VTIHIFPGHWLDEWNPVLLKPEPSSLAGSNCLKNFSPLLNCYSLFNKGFGFFESGVVGMIVQAY